MSTKQKTQDHKQEQAPSKFSGGLKPAIERNVPIPRKRSSTAHPYDFHLMEVGDSLFLESTKEKPVNISNVKIAAEKRVPNTKWTTRSVSEPELDEETGETIRVRDGYRIWRIE